jgi:hypothetical protein
MPAAANDWLSVDFHCASSLRTPQMFLFHGVSPMGNTSTIDRFTGVSHPMVPLDRPPANGAQFLVRPRALSIREGSPG